MGLALDESGSYTCAKKMAFDNSGSYACAMTMKNDTW